MTKSYFVIFSILFCACSGVVSKAQIPAVVPAQAPVDAITEQTKRVTGDSVLHGILKSFEQKYNVQCQIPLKDDDGPNQNPKWMCLNNNACSYRIKVACYQTTGHKNQLLEIDVAGFDNGVDSEIQAVTVNYLQK